MPSVLQSSTTMTSWTNGWASTRLIDSSTVAASLKHGMTTDSTRVGR